MEMDGGVVRRDQDPPFAVGDGEMQGAMTFQLGSVDREPARLVRGRVRDFLSDLGIVDVQGDDRAGKRVARVVLDRAADRLGSLVLLRLRCRLTGGGRLSCHASLLRLCCVGGSRALPPARNAVVCLKWPPAKSRSIWC
jgi:hypothetical protein